MFYIIWAIKNNVCIPVKVVDTDVEAKTEVKKLINVDAKGYDEVVL